MPKMVIPARAPENLKSINQNAIFIEIMDKICFIFLKNYSFISYRNYL